MKKTKKENGHWGEVAKSLAEGVFKKMSFDLVLGIKEQWEKFLFRTKSGVVAVVFIVLGMIFIMIGLANLLQSLLSDIPGAGFMMIGIVLALIGWVVSIIKRMV